MISMRHRKLWFIFYILVSKEILDVHAVLRTAKDESTSSSANVRKKSSSDVVSDVKGLAVDRDVGVLHSAAAIDGEGKIVAEAATEDDMEISRGEGKSGGKSDLKQEGEGKHGGKSGKGYQPPRRRYSPPRRRYSPPRRRYAAPTPGSPSGCVEPPRRRAPPRRRIGKGSPPRRRSPVGFSCGPGQYSRRRSNSCDTCTGEVRRRRAQCCVPCGANEVNIPGQDACATLSCDAALISTDLDGVHNMPYDVLVDLVDFAGKEEWATNGVRAEILDTLNDYRQMSSSATNFSAMIGIQTSNQISNLAMAAVATVHGSRGEWRGWAKPLEDHVNALPEAPDIWGWYSVCPTELKSALRKLGMYVLSESYEFNTTAGRSSMVESESESVSESESESVSESERELQDEIEFDSESENGGKDINSEELKQEGEGKVDGKSGKGYNPPRRRYSPPRRRYSPPRRRYSSPPRRRGKGGYTPPRRRYSPPRRRYGPPPRRRCGKGYPPCRRRRAPPPTPPVRRRAPWYAKDCFNANRPDFTKELTHTAGFLLMDAWQTKYRIFYWLVLHGPGRNGQNIFCQWQWFLHQRTFDKKKTVEAIAELTNPTVRGWFEADEYEDFARNVDMAFADLAELGKVIASFMSGLNNNPPPDDVLDAQAKGMQAGTNAAIITYIETVSQLVELDHDIPGGYYKSQTEIDRIQSGLMGGSVEVLSGPCAPVPGSGCITSQNYPSHYHNNHKCSLSFSGRVSVSEFETEGYFDRLHVDGTAYSGRNGPPVNTDLSGKTVSWTSDYSVTRKGWRICVGSSSSDSSSDSSSSSLQEQRQQPAGLWCGSVGSLPADHCPSTAADDPNTWLRKATALFKAYFCARMDQDHDQCEYTGQTSLPSSLIEGAGSGVDDVAGLFVLAKDSATLRHNLEACKADGQNCAENKDVVKGIADITLGVTGTMQAIWGGFKLANYFKDSISMANSIKAQGQAIARQNAYLNGIGKFMNGAKQKLIVVDTAIDVTLTSSSGVVTPGQLISTGGNWHFKAAGVADDVPLTFKYSAVKGLKAFRTKMVGGVAAGGTWMSCSSSVTTKLVVANAKMAKFTVFLTVVGIAFDLYTFGTAVAACHDGDKTTDCDWVTAGLALASAIGGIITLGVILLGLGPVGMAVGAFIMAAAGIAMIFWSLFKPQPEARQETGPDKFRNAWCCAAAKDAGVPNSSLAYKMASPGTYTAHNPCSNWVKDNCGCDWGQWNPSGDSLCQGSTCPNVNDCFPSAAKVYVKGHGSVRIDRLQQGNLILSVDGSGSTFYDEVSFYSLADPTRKSEPFLAVGTSTKRVIRITPGHHLPVGPKCCGDLKIAKNLRVGDLIWTVAPEDQTATLDTVKFIETVEDDGMHSPVMLQGGHPIVDGVVTSFDNLESINMAARWMPFLTRLCTAGNMCGFTAKMIKKFECLVKGECGHREVIVGTQMDAGDIKHANSEQVIV